MVVDISLIGPNDGFMFTVSKTGEPTSPTSILSLRLVVEVLASRALLHDVEVGEHITF